jgi:hypothetical protein
MFTKQPPKTGKKNGEIRYWAFRDADGKLYLEKVKCIRKLFDKENDNDYYSCMLLEPISEFRLGMKPGYITYIDHAWQLQKTLEDAQRLLILGVLKEADFLLSSSPWEQ